MSLDIFGKIETESPPTSMLVAAMRRIEEHIDVRFVFDNLDEEDIRVFEEEGLTAPNGLSFTVYASSQSTDGIALWNEALDEGRNLLSEAGAAPDSYASI